MHTNKKKQEPGIFRNQQAEALMWITGLHRQCPQIVDHSLQAERPSRSRPEISRCIDSPGKGYRYSQAWTSSREYPSLNSLKKIFLVKLTWMNTDPESICWLEHNREPVSILPPCAVLPTCVTRDLGNQSSWHCRLS